jgi:hypothetical protein
MISIILYSFLASRILIRVFIKLQIDLLHPDKTLPTGGRKLDNSNKIDEYRNNAYEQNIMGTLS